MSQTSGEASVVLRDLGDGLVLRRGTTADAEALGDFQAVVNSLTETPDEHLRSWTIELVRGSLPSMGPEDFTLVQDTRTREIVSTLNLISQTWSYGGVEFGVGRVELVGTRPEYRRRGLIRAQIEVVHQWSSARGEKLQGITGIPWYYRRFGYEMALEHMGGRTGYAPNVPRLAPGQREPFRLRPATDDDLPFITRTYTHGMRRDAVACVRDEAMWRYELHARGGETIPRHVMRVVETEDGEPAGFLSHAPMLSNGELTVTIFELRPGASWLAVMPSVVRYLHSTGEEYAARDGAGGFSEFTFELGSDHPAYRAAGERLPRARRPYAWYVRVADVPDFVRHVGPVLERRLAGSAADGHTGDLKISFVYDGFKLSFHDGRLTDVGRWMPTQLDSRLAPITRDALFPSLTFLQLLFGFRSVEDLEYAFPDCIMSSDESRELLTILFPKKPSMVWGVE